MSGSVFSCLDGLDTGSSRCVNRNRRVSICFSILLWQHTQNCATLQLNAIEKDATMPENERTWEANYLNKLLNELDAETDIAIGLLPGSSAGKSAHNGTGLEFRLGRKGEYPTRTLYLTLDRYTIDGSLHEKAKSDLRFAILDFWKHGNKDRARKIRIEC